MTLCHHTFRETFHGVTVIDDDVPIGLVGVLHTSPMQAVSYQTDELKRRPKTIVRAARLFRETVLSQYDEVYAVSDASDRFLDLAGFEYVATTTQGRTFRCHKRLHS